MRLICTALRTGCLLALVPITMASLAPATAADDFYRGKTITIVAGFSPGGGYDANARAVSRFLGKYIPGNPTVIVQNMPGAGSLTAVRGLDATLAKDGTVMVTFNPGLITQGVIDPSKVPVDFRKFAWIGTITADFRVCSGFGPNGVKTWDDLMKRKEFILGATAKGAGNYINGATLKIIFNAPVRQILGYPGSNEQRIAIERGELDGDCGSFSSIPIEWLRDKKSHPFVRFSERKGAEIPDSAVYIGTFAKTDEQRQLLNVLYGADEIGRPYIMSRQVPADRVAIVRKAFIETMRDPAFLAEMEKQQLPVYPLDGEAAAAIVANLPNISPAVAAKAREIYE